MSVLIDTQSFLFAAGDSSRLSAGALAAVTDRTAERLLSDVSCWEMAIKYAIGKLQVPGQLSDFVEQQCAALSLRPLAITRKHTLRVAELPLHHRDPFDRLLVAQALVEGIPIVSNDAALDAYGVTRIW
ncbi:MAG: type II toxin-antitoxin system VapC family toxin [Dehalococcoidia bacterium]